jgi:hypothetical protein
VQVAYGEAPRFLASNTAAGREEALGTREIGVGEPPARAASSAIEPKAAASAKIE